MAGHLFTLIPRRKTARRYLIGAYNVKVDDDVAFCIIAKSLHRPGQHDGKSYILYSLLRIHTQLKWICNSKSEDSAKGSEKKMEDDSSNRFGVEVSTSATASTAEDRKRKGGAGGEQVTTAKRLIVPTARPSYRGKYYSRGGPAEKQSFLTVHASYSIR